MNNLQQWSHRFFLVAITTVLAFALGSLGDLVASHYYVRLLQYYNVSLQENQLFWVRLGFVIIGFFSALLLGSWFTQRLWASWEMLERLPLADKVAVLFGVLVGLALAYLVLLMPMMLLRGKVGSPLPLLALAVTVTLIIVFFSVHTLLKVRDAVSMSFPQLAQILRATAETSISDHRLSRARDKLLDTSVIIDGRLTDIMRTGFVEGRLLIPSFILNELQMIADSEDELRRARGRRGLSVLEALRGLPNAIVDVIDQFSPEVESAPSTDLKLVRLAKEHHAALITNDNNLQKIAELQGIPVMCVNELATALKPVVLPGEDLTVVVQRAGKETGQGVGYLEDGTMVVVERGRQHIGHEVRIRVTSILQSPVGKMIFGDFKEVVRRNVFKAEGGDLFDDDFGGARRWSGKKA